MKNKKLLLILSVLSILFLLSFSSNAKAFDNIVFDFQRDILFDNSQPELNLFNMRPQQVYNGTYGGSYSFSYDINGSNPLGWILDEGGGTIKVIDYLDGHSKVLELYDDSIVDDVFLYNDFTSQTSGTIEFWWSTSNVAKTNELNLRQGTTHKIRWRVTASKLQYFYSGIWNDATNGGVSSNLWYHTKLIFDCSSDTYSYYLNGILLDSGVAFSATAISIDDILLSTGGGDTEYYMYFDAIGYSWDITERREIIDFSDDIDNTEPIGFVSDNDVSCYTNISSGVFGETKVLQIYDGSYNGGAELGVASISKTFDNPILDQEGISFDIARSDDTFSNYRNISFYEGATEVIRIFFSDNDIYNWFEGTFDIIDLNELFEPEIFTTIKIVFNHSSDTFNFYINNTKWFPPPSYSVNHPYLNNVIEGITSINFNSEGSTPNQFESYTAYYDNIYMFLDFYISGYNFQPILETMEGFEGLLETDKYEFSFLNVNERVALSLPSFGLWTLAWDGNADSHIQADDKSYNPNSNNDLDRVVGLITNVEGNATMTRTNLGASITQNLIDVSVGFHFQTIGSTSGILKCLLESSDGTLISGFKIDLSTNELFGLDNSGWVSLRNDIQVQIFYEINMFINYEAEAVMFSFSVNNTFIQNYILSTVVSGKNGLNEIDINNYSDGNLNVVEVDYVGLYRDGESWHGELGVITTSLNVDYHFGKHHLYSIIGTGRFHDGVVEGNYVGDETSFQSVRNISTISGVPKDGTLNITNTGNFFWSETQNATLVFTCVGSEISISSISIEGSKLVQNSNEYFIEYSSNGVDSRDNYFYVSGNDLKFTYNAKYDDTLEFIQAEFNINDITSIDTVISFYSGINGNAFGVFRINYTDMSQIIPIENILKTKRVFLTTNKTIRSFIILISDTNKDYISGLSTGLVSDIVLLDVENAIVSIVSLSLVEMIIPLIIILLPTLAISALYGDFLVVPIFLLMSLITAITSIIPIWLFFVIALSNVLFIFFDNKRKDIYRE